MKVDVVSRFAAQLYEGITCVSTWSAALGALARNMEVGAVSIIRIDDITGSVVVTDIEGPDSMSLRILIEEHIETVDGLKAARACASICDRLRRDAVPYFSQDTLPMQRDRITDDGVRMRWLPLASSEGASLAMLLSCNPGQVGTLPSSELMRHLSCAARLRRHVGVLARTSAIGERVMERFTLPLMVVNRAAKVLHTNTSGRLWLDYLNDIKTVPTSTEDEEVLTAIDRVCRFAKELCNGDDSSPSTMLLEGVGSSRHVLVIGVPLAGRAADDDGSPLGLIVAHDRTSHRPSWLPLLAATFSLSPAEQRLLEQMVCDDSLDTAIDSLGISKETARSHLKSIFAKTGTKRQAGLMRMVTNVAQMH